MIEKVKEQYYEMGFRMMSGIVVDKELRDKLQEVLEEARGKIFKLLDENPEHCKLTETSYAYPNGKQTEFLYIEPSRWFSLHTRDRKVLLNKALNMEEVTHLFEADSRMDMDDIRGFVQRSIENDKRKGGWL